MELGPLGLDRENHGYGYVPLRLVGGTGTSLGECRALTPLFGNGARAFRIGKNSVVSTKIGKSITFYA